MCLLEKGLCIMEAESIIYFRTIVSQFSNKTTLIHRLSKGESRIEFSMISSCRKQTDLICLEVCPLRSPSTDKDGEFWPSSSSSSEQASSHLWVDDTKA